MAKKTSKKTATAKKTAKKAVKKAVKKSTPKRITKKAAAKKAAAKKAATKSARRKMAAKKTPPRKAHEPIVEAEELVNGCGRGMLISFEGSEGSGKSTQVSRVAEMLEEEGHEVVVTREPGGTVIGEEIRHLLMHAPEGTSLTPEAELLLFAASRAQLVREVILPALDEGKIVLCDRFLDSTTVYQGVGRRIASEPVHIINTFAVGDVIPDLTIVIDVPAELGFKRIRHRASDLPDRMESETIDFYKKVRDGYLILATSMPERFAVVDGTKQIEQISADIMEELRKHI